MDGNLELPGTGSSLFKPLQTDRLDDDHTPSISRQLSEKVSGCSCRYAMGRQTIQLLGWMLLRRHGKLKHLPTYQPWRWETWYSSIGVVTMIAQPECKPDEA